MLNTRVIQMKSLKISRKNFVMEVANDSSVP